MNCHRIKKSRLKLWSITNDLLPDTVIVLWRINFKFIPSLTEHRCRHDCYSCLVAETKQSGGDSGCTLRTIVLCQLSWTEKHPMPSNTFELAVASFFQSSAMIDEIKSFEQPLKLYFSQLLIRTTSGDVASDDVSSSEALCLQMLLMTSALQEHFVFRCFKLSICWFHCSHLFFQNLCFKIRH